MSISSTAGQFSLYYSSESWFQSLEGTKGSAGSNLQEMTGKLLQELRFRSRIIIAIAGVISIIGHSLTAAGLGIFNAIPPAVLRDAAAAHNGSLGSVPAVVTAYGLTTAGMTIVHTWTAVTVIVLSYFMYKYGSMLAEMIMDTVNKMGGGTGKKGAAYEKMEARAQEVGDLDDKPK